MQTNPNINRCDYIHLPTNRQIGEITLDEYEPNANRTIRPKPMGSVAAYMNMFKATLGTGLLSIPIAFKHMGICLGPIILILTGILVVYCATLSIKNIRKICITTKNANVTFAHAMRISMEKGPRIFSRVSEIMPCFVNLLIIVCQFLTLASYILFMATVIKQIFNIYSHDVDLRVCVLIMLLPLLILNCFLRSLKWVAYFSIFGNIVQVLAVIISYVYLSGNFKSSNELNMIGPWNEILVGFGTGLYSFTSVGVIMSLEYNTKQPNWFLKPHGVLNMGTILPSIVYISVGVLGYAKFGSGIAGTYITNFPNSHLSSVGLAAFGIAILSGFLIHIYPIAEIVIRFYITKKNKAFTALTWKEVILVDIGSRFVIILAAGFGVLLFKQIHLLIGLIGSFFMLTLNIIFPCVMECCMAIYEEPKNKRRVWISGTLCFFLIILCFLSVINTVVHMISSAFH